MNWQNERRIRDAIRSGNAQELHDAVSCLPSYDRDFDAVKQVVEDAGGSRYIRGITDRIVVSDPCDGTTTISNKFGTAQSDHDET